SYALVCALVLHRSVDLSRDPASLVGSLVLDLDLAPRLDLSPFLGTGDHDGTLVPDLNLGRDRTLVLSWESGVHEGTLVLDLDLAMRTALTSILVTRASRRATSPRHETR